MSANLNIIYYLCRWMSRIKNLKTEESNRFFFGLRSKQQACLSANRETAIGESCQLAIGAKERLTTCRGRKHVRRLFKDRTPL
jgi:hypothetical protein